MTQWIAETLVATTLLMLFVLAIRPWVAGRFGARAAYLLWFAPALRMILPPLPANWFGDQGAAVQDVVVVLAGVSSPSFQPAITTGGGTAWPIASLTIWLGGAILFFGRHWFSYLRFSRDVAEKGRALFDAGNIPVTASPAVSSPIALGVFGRSVIVPEDFEHRYDAAEQRLAVAHELTHHGRHDVPVNFAALAILSLHWWNPVAHIAHRAFRLDQEAACDAIVLAGATAEDRHAYGSALFKSAMGRVPLAACAMGATTTLKARLRRIISGQDTRLARPGAALAAFFVLGGVVATASGGVRETAAASIAYPGTLVLNGGVIDPSGLVLASATAPVASKDGPACPDARRKAAQRAKAAMRIARADQGRAMADARDAANDAAEADLDAREAMEDARSVQREAMLEAQAATDEAMAEARAAQAEARAALASARSNGLARARATAISCGRGRHDGLAALDTVTDANGKKQIRVVLCGNGADMHPAQIVESLKTARAEIENDPMLPGEARAHVIAALDRQIAAFRANPMTLQ